MILFQFYSIVLQCDVTAWASRLQ